MIWLMRFENNQIGLHMRIDSIVPCQLYDTQRRDRPIGTCVRVTRVLSSGETGQKHNNPTK